MLAKVCCLSQSSKTEADWNVFTLELKTSIRKNIHTADGPQTDGLLPLHGLLFLL